MDLRTAILTYGRAEGDMLRVERFLNHRVDPKVMSTLGEDLAALLADHQPDLILTAEASGIAPALAAAQVMGLPLVFAKKYVRSGARNTYCREVASPTRGTEYRVEVACHLLEEEGNVAVVDDFLAGGRTAEALGEITEESGCRLVGLAFAVEKAFTGGRARLEAHGWQVWSVVTVTSLRGGTITLAD